MGVSPAISEFIFIGQDIQGTFTIFSGGEKNIRIRAEGELAPYVKFENSKSNLETHMIDALKVPFSIELPEDLKPGNYKITIIANQFLTPEEVVRNGGVNAFAAIAYIIRIRIPNEGPFLEGSMRVTPEKINVGTIAYFHLDLLNFGTEGLQNIQSKVIVKDPSENILSEEKTNSIDKISPGGTGELISFWRTENAKSGRYTAESSIEYGGKFPLNLRAIFRVGDIFININNVKTELNGTIAKFLINIESNWNELIDNVYAEIEISKDNEIIDTIKTSSVNLEPWGKDTLTAFWERGSLLSGYYDVSIRVYYYNKYEERQMQVRLEELKEDTPAPVDNTLLYTIVILLSVILIVNILWFIFKKKK